MAARYAGFRSSWLLWGREERISRDESRTACHDSLIVRFNQLARYLRSQGKDAAWRTFWDMAEEADRYCRKRIGDFRLFYRVYERAAGPVKKKDRQKRRGTQ